MAASRLEAMALKRREYYFRTDRDGNYQIYEGIPRRGPGYLRYPGRHLY